MKTLKELCISQIANNITVFSKAPLPKGISKRDLFTIINKAGSRLANEDLLLKFEKHNPHFESLFDQGWKVLYQKAFRQGQKYKDFLKKCQNHYKGNFTWKLAFQKSKKYKDKLLKKGEKNVRKALKASNTRQNSTVKIKRLELVSPSNGKRNIQHVSRSLNLNTSNKKGKLSKIKQIQNNIRMHNHLTRT
eukprot:maker-scaffold_8-snap-gene-5.1-mRNA-1 protein AED:0.11 eAED:0.11 QI:144/1/1/1/1/1/3/89/190